MSDVIKLAGQEPIIGHKSGRNSKTHWLVFVAAIPLPQFVVLAAALDGAAGNVTDKRRRVAAKKGE